MANIISSNWAAFATAADSDWTIDATNRIFEYTGADTFISFLLDFDDIIPVTLIIPRISQITSNITIRMHNARIIWTTGAANFGPSPPNQNTFASTTGITNTEIDIQNCVFVASNGAENGLGGAGNRAAGNATGTLSNNTFFGINTDTIWFVNAAGIPQVSLANNIYNQTTLHSGEESGGDADGYPTVITGSFDGATRTDSGGAYTLRRVRYDNGTWSYHTDCTFAGTDYRTTAGTANNQLSILQTNETAADQIEFSLNNQIESSNYSFQKTSAASFTLYDGYTWNPVFVDRISGDSVGDVVLTHSTAFGSDSRVFNGPTTVDLDTVPTATTSGALISAGGYIVHTGGATSSTANRVVVTDKALNFSTGEPRAAHTYGMTGKSYTHNQVADTVSTVVNRITDSSTGTFPIHGGSWEYLTEDTHNLTADTLVEGVSLATANSQNPNTLGGIYQSVKALWYGSTDTNPLSHHMSVSGASLVLGGGSFYGHTDTRSTTLSDVGGLRFRSAGTTAIAAGDGLDNIDLNGNSFGILNADTITFPILDSGTTGTWQYTSGLTFPGNFLVADTSGALEGTLSLPPGTYQINNADISNLTIRADPAGTVTVRTSGTTGTATPHPDGGVTITAVPETRSYVVPAQAGNFVVRQVGAGSSDVNTVERTIAADSNLSHRTFELEASSDGNSYQIYWKPDSSATEEDGYSITHIGPVASGDVTTTETINISNTPISDVLYEFDTLNTLTMTWDPDDNDFITKGASDEYFALPLSVSGAEGSTVDGGTTLAGFYQAANEMDYLRLVAQNFLTGSDIDIIAAAGAGVTDIDERYITLTSGGTQQLLQGLVFTGPSAESLPTSETDTAVVNLVTSTPNPDGITIGEVRTATNEALDTNERLQETENGIAYMLSDGSTSPAIDSRLAGIRPKSADYDSGTDYTTIFDE